MIPQTPTLENKSLYEIFGYTNTEGFDICDDVWDWGIYIGCARSFEECGDSYYEKLMLLFCLNINCSKVQADWYSVCNVSTFIKQNLKVFKTFFNKYNREGYRPKDYKNADDDNKDDGFYEAYMMPMESLIAGNYCESHYKELYLKLGGK